MKYDNSCFKRLIPTLVLLGLPMAAWPQVALAPQANIEDKYGSSSGTTSTTGSAGSVDETTIKADPNAAPPGNSDDLVYLNAADVEIKDLIKQISKAAGINFLIDDKVRGKVTIISEKPMTKDMAYQAFLSALQVMGFTTVQTPSGLLKIVPTKQAINEPIDFYKNETPNTDRFITRIVQVKNISANELSTVVKGLVSKDGNMFAYPATNSLIITDTGSNIDRILSITRELDQEGPQEVIEIIPIRNASSKDITDKVLQLYEDEVGGKAGTAKAKRGRSGGGGELEDAPSISKVISDERTNSIIILGSKRAIIKVRELIAQLDSPINGIEGSIHVYYLKHANGKEMAEVLSALVSGADKKSKGAAGGAPDAGAKTGKSTSGVTLESDVKVTADESTNSLVITASPKDYETLMERVIAKLDIPRRQVYLEAVVMELDVTKHKTLGMQGNFGSLFSMFGDSLSGFGSILPSFPGTIGSIATATGGLAGGAFSERGITLPGTTTEIPAVSVLIQALQQDSDVNVLSTPSIMTLDNEEASIQVGEDVPIKSGTSIANGLSNLNITRKDVGIILKVTPQISESNTVRLKISQEVSQVGGKNDDGTIFSKRKVDTVVVADDKQTIVIGGLIDDHNNVSTGRVPYLGDIPVLGNLFKTRDTVKDKKNIMIFITPYIIRERSDYLAILQRKIEERNLFIDLNYGVGQRRQIRESIKNHAKDLLEYRGDVSNVPATNTTVSSQTPYDAKATPKVVESNSGSKYQNR